MNAQEILESAIIEAYDNYMSDTQSRKLTDQEIAAITRSISAILYKLEP